jgi:hypothetical protein
VMRDCMHLFSFRVELTGGEWWCSRCGALHRHFDGWTRPALDGDKPYKPGGKPEGERRGR